MQFRIKERFTNTDSNEQLESIMEYHYNTLCLLSGYTMKTVQLLLSSEHFRVLKIASQPARAEPCEIYLKYIAESVFLKNNWYVITMSY